MKTAFIALVCLIGIPVFAADMPKPPMPMSPELNDEIIKKTPSYSEYTTADGTPAQSWKDAAGAILFYKKEDPYFEFTNMYQATITLKEVEWPSVEHYFQAMKFHNTTLQEKIRKANTPGAASRLGNENRHLIRDDWKQISLAILAFAIHAKFSQHAQLAQSLLETGTLPLVHDTHVHSSVFGAGPDYKGDNFVGRILMLVRTVLVQQSNG